MSVGETVLLQEVANVFDELIGHLGQHGVVSGDMAYIQPHVYLSLHLVQMRAAGWDVDFDDVAAVSGASALFAYQPGAFMPKYAHLVIDPDRRIAEATGFGYEWAVFEGPEAAWKQIVAGVDADIPLKGWDWENILFAGYREAETPGGRQVYALADGPDTYARWLSWEAFGEWAERVSGWGVPTLGRHTGLVEALPAQEVALRVMRDLVAWSAEPPPTVREQHPQAAFGLAGIELYAAACEASSLDDDWVACHDVNGQWGMRNATGVYLERIAAKDLFLPEVNAHLTAAATKYRCAYQSWRTMYEKHLGHNVPEAQRKTREHRVAGAAAVREALAREKAALAELEQALALLDG